MRKSNSRAGKVPGDIAALARANCYIVIPPDREHYSLRESGCHHDALDPACTGCGGLFHVR